MSNSNILKDCPTLMYIFFSYFVKLVYKKKMEERKKERNKSYKF